MEEDEEQQLEDTPENLEHLTLRSVLMPLSETDLLHLTNIDGNSPETNKVPTTWADEYIIQHRGRRRKPITWSPLDYNKVHSVEPERKMRTKIPRRSEISSKLKRRLILGTNEERNFSNCLALGESIALKLQAISTWREEESQ